MEAKPLLEFAGDDLLKGPFMKEDSGIPLTENLRQLLQSSAVTPYTLREKHMCSKSLGWKEPDEQGLTSSITAPPTNSNTDVSRGRKMSAGRPTGRREPRKPWPPLYDAPDISKRYRKIEDLQFYMATGTINESTIYFKDAMQRRVGDKETFALPEQHIIALDHTDPRFAPCWVEEKEKSKLSEIIPKRVQYSQQKFNQTTGLVKPYASGSGHRWKSEKFMDLLAIENSMDTYVMKMQCERPTKGLHTRC